MHHIYMLSFIWNLSSSSPLLHKTYAVARQRKCNEWKWAISRDIYVYATDKHIYQWESTAYERHHIAQFISRIIDKNSFKNIYIRPAAMRILRSRTNFCHYIAYVRFTRRNDFKLLSDARKMSQLQANYSDDNDEDKS